MLTIASVALSMLMSEYPTFCFSIWKASRYVSACRPAVSALNP